MRTIHKKFTLVLLLLLSISAFADSAGENRAIFARSLFEKACYLTYGIPERVTKWAEDSALLEIPQDSLAKAFPVPPIRAWSVKNGLGDYMVAFSNNGICSVFVWEVDVAALKEQFNKTLPGLDTGLTAEKKVEKTTPVSGGEKYVVGYEISGPKALLKIIVLLQTNSSSQSGMQGRMDISFSRKPQ